MPKKISEASNADPSQEEYRTVIDSALITMPYVRKSRPAQALGLLRAIPKGRFTARRVYADPLLADLIGTEDYLFLSGSGPDDALTDWTLSIKASRTTPTITTPRYRYAGMTG